MATYRAENLTQTVEPASADYGARAASIQRAGAATADQYTFYGKLIKSGMAAYTDYDIRSTTSGKFVKDKKGNLVETDEDPLRADELVEAYTLRQKAKDKADLLEKERARIAGGTYQYDSPLEGGMFPDAQKADIARYEAAKASTLTAMDVELQRLKDASKGGMSPEELVARVSSITKKAIAKYPHMTDEIRQRVGIATGLPYADQWASMQYVKDTITNTQKSVSDASKALSKDVDDLVNNGFFATRQEAMTAAQSGSPEWGIATNRLSQIRSLNFSQQAVEAKLQTTTIVADSDATRQLPLFKDLFTTVAGANLLKSGQAERTLYEEALKFQREGKGFKSHPDAFAASVKQHTTLMKGALQSAYYSAREQMQMMFSKNGNISIKTQNEMLKNLEEEYNTRLKQYGDENTLLQLAEILVGYSDKTFEQQLKSLDLSVKLINVLPQNYRNVFFSGTPEQRDQLKRNNPYIYDYLVNMEQTLQSNSSGMGDALKVGGDLAALNNVVTEAMRDPTPKTTEADPNTARVIHDQSFVVAKDRVDDLGLGKVLSPPDVNVISSGFSTNVSYGANANNFMNNYERFWANLSKLPKAQLSIIRNEVSKGAVTAMTKVQDYLKQAEEKYGVKLNLDLNTDGEVRVLFTSKEATRFSMDNNYKNAAEEFTKNSLPLIRTAIYGRASVTGEEPVIAGREFLTVLQSGSVPKGFFSTEAVASTPEASGTVQQLEGQTAPTKSTPPAVEGKPIPQATDAVTKAPAAQKATGPRRIKDDIESLTWLTKKQKDIFYGVVQQMVALDPNYNLTRLADILLTASDVDKENILKVIKEQSK